MVERVGDDRVFVAQDGFEQPAIGVEAARIEDGILHPEEPGNLALQLAMDVLGAADEADRGHAEAVAAQPVGRRLHQPGIIGQAQIVVGAEIQHFRPVRQVDGRALGRADQALRLPEPVGLDLLQGPLELAIERGLHGRYLSLG